MSDPWTDAWQREIDDDRRAERRLLGATAIALVGVLVLVLVRLWLVG